MKNALIGSWQSTLAGWLIGGIIILRSIAGFAGTEIPVFNEDGTPKLDENGVLVTQSPGSFDINSLILAGGFIGMGSVVRDNNKRSEDVGAG